MTNSYNYGIFELFIISIMNSNSELFHLIRSLSAGEKRFFRLYASRHKGNKKYTRLFDAVGKQKQYDEAKLKALFKGERTLNQFPVMKHYLHSLVLKCMHFYHSESSVVARLSEMLHQAEFLFNKGLYPQSSKQVERARQLALKYEKEVYLLEVFRWEQKLLVATGDPERMEESSEERFRLELGAVERLRNSIEFKRLANRSFGLQKRIGAARNSEQKAAFRAISDHPLMQSESKALGYESKAHYFNAMSVYHLSAGDQEKGYLFCKNYVSLFDTYPLQRNEDTDRYIFALNNLIAVCRLTRRTAEFHRALSLLRSVDCRDLQTRAKVFVRAGGFELSFYNQSGDFEKGAALVPSLTQGLEQYRGLISREYETVYHYQFARLSFGTGNYAKSLQWINKILNDTGIDSREDIVCFARLLNLILHFERNDPDLLAYAVRSTYRFLRKRKRLYKFETIVLDFISKRSTGGWSEKEQIKVFTDLHAQLSKVLKDPFEKRVLDYFDMLSWLESKIKNRPFAEIVRSNYKGR